MHKIGYFMNIFTSVNPVWLEMVTPHTKKFTPACGGGTEVAANSGITV